MKIAFYTDTYLPNTDGVVSQIIASKKELEKRRHKIHVFAPGTHTEVTGNKDNTVTYYEGIKFPLYPQYKLAIFPFSSTLECKNLGVEIVHSHALATMGVASMVSAKALRLPLIGTFHTMVPLASHYLTKNKRYQEVLTDAAWKAIKTFYQPFDLVTAPSKVIAQLLETHEVKDVKVVSNGIDTRTFSPKAKQSYRKELGIAQGETALMFVGRITKEKRVDVVLKAFAKLNPPKARLVVIGNGPAFTEVKRLANTLKLGAKVQFTGEVKHEQMPGYLAACDWQISASTFETQGLGILEGMACGKPCIGTNSLAIPEMVKNGQNGIIFKELDVTDCCDKIEEALGISEKKYKQLSRNAVETASEHSIQKTTDQWEKLYKSML